MMSVRWLDIRPFFWFFFQPERWEAVLHQQTGLEVGTSLLQISSEQWRKPSLLILLAQMYLLLPALGSLLLFGLITLLFPPPLVFSLFGWALGVFAGVLVGIYVSLEAGMMVAAVSSWLLMPVSVNSQLIAFDLVEGNTFGWLLGLIGGAACATAVEVTPRQSQFAPARQAGGMLIGLMISTAVFFIALQTTNQLVIHWQAGRLNSLSTSLVIGAVPCIILSLAATIQSRNWRKGCTAGLVSGLTLSLLALAFLRNAAFDTDIVGVTLRNLMLVVLIAMFLILYTLPFVIARGLGGIWAGAVAAGLAISAYHPAFEQFFTLYQMRINLALSLGLVILGLTVRWWRPVVSYPFQLVWNTLLLRVQETILPQRNLISWHAALWDKRQYLPFTDLPDMLLFLYRQNPQMGSDAINLISHTRQRWASQTAQIELDVEQLSCVETIETIRTIHREIGQTGLNSPIASLLHTFAQFSQDIDAILSQQSHYNRRLGLRTASIQIQALIRELTRSDEPYAVQFLPVATLWHEIVQTTIQAMESLAEVLQEINDPYVVGIPLAARQHTFVGRKQITQRIEQLLLNGQRPPLLLYGQRRMGKTSLLNNLGTLLPQRFLPLFVDLQGPVSFAADHAGLLYNIARQIKRSAIETRGVVLPDLARATILSDPATRFDEWLDAVEQSLPAKDSCVLLMMDEFEVLDGALQTKRFDEAFVLGMLRHIIQHRHRFKLMLAGSHTLDEFKRWSGYFINAEVLHLGNLDQEEAVQLITAPIDPFPLTYEAPAIKRLLTLTNGHPYLLQLIGSEIIAVKNRQPLNQRFVASLADVETAVEPTLRRGALFFADIEQNQVSLNGLTLLRRLAKSSNISVETVEDTAHLLPELLEREILTQNEKEIYFTSELLRLWFAQ